MHDFVSLALVLGLAATGGIIARLLKQPLLLGYIAAGVVIASLGWLTGQQPAWEWMGQLGVTLLLFLVGLELPVAQLKALGKVALLGGLGQVIFTTLLAYPLLLLLGFSPLASWYLSLALSFSSTAITIHILTEKKDLHSLYGKITVGILLIQDFVAIGLLMILSGSTSGTTLMPWSLVVILLKGGILTVLAIWLSGRVLPKLLAHLGASGEILLVVALTWCLGIAALVASPLIGFSVQIGGFLAGLALSGAAEHLQIGARIRPLRDFFLTLFFVYLGTHIHWGDIGGLWGRVLILSLFVLVAKPVITWVILSLLGYQRRPAFLVGINCAQISEFSLILIAAVAQARWVGNSELATIAMVGAVTMIGSNYLVLSANRIYSYLRPYLSRGKSDPQQELDHTLSGHIVLVGCNRTGRAIYPTLKGLGGEVVVVDFNPQTVQELNETGQMAVYGDLADYDLYEQLNLQHAQLVVSTVTDLSDNLQFLSYLIKSATRPLTIVTAADASDAQLLYRAKADYAVVPAEVGGELIAHLLAKHGLNRSKFKSLRSRLGR